MAAFSRLRALCTQFNDTPEQASRPFDLQRKGFVLSEGAAAVILQAWPPPDDFLRESFDEPPTPIAEIIGFGRSGKFFKNLLLIFHRSKVYHLPNKLLLLLLPWAPSGT
ncbi:unnamed protein product [Trichobilharzia regenti]|nr:unnamed protein product [Trichobilharzia regenti]